MINIKQSRKHFHLYLMAFLGGTCLQWIQLADMLKTTPENINVYFFCAMIVAGILGIFAFIVGGNEHYTKSGCFLIGMSAPQLLGGVIKTGTIVTPQAAAPAVTQFLAGVTIFFGSPAVAGEAPQQIIPDTSEIVISVEGTHEDILVVDEETKEEYKASYKEPITIPKSKKYKVTTKSGPGKIIEVNTGYHIDSTQKIKVIVIEKKRLLSVFQGLFPGQHKNHNALTQKIEIQQENIHAVIDTADIIDDSTMVAEEGTEPEGDIE